jgi:hypothetical protein
MENYVSSLKKEGETNGELCIQQQREYMFLISNKKKDRPPYHWKNGTNQLNNINSFTCLTPTIGNTYFYLLVKRNK